MKIRLLFWAFVLIFAWQSFPIAAQDSASPVSMLVDLGYDSYYRLNYWLPIRVQIRNDGAPITGRISVRPESSGRAVSSAYSTPIELPTGSEKTSFLYIQAEAQAINVLVELIDNEGVRVAEVRVGLVAIDAHDSLHMVVSSTGANSIPLNNLTTGGYLSRTGRWELSNFPPDVAALLALDTLIFYDVNTDEMSVGQRDALAQWVSLGGHLIVVGGPNWSQTASGILDLLPFTPENSGNLPNLNPLADYIGDSSRLEQNAVYTMGTIKDDAQSLISAEDGTALLIRRTLGAGTVDYLTVDPTLEPLRSWANLPRFWLQILGNAAPEVGWNRGFLDDTQTAQAIAILPTVDLLPPVSNMLIYILAYILLIGPINYWVLARMKRLGWAWFTIPLLIFGFTSFAWTFGFNLRGSEVILSRLYVIQSYPDTAIARQDELIGLLSPRREVYSVTAPQGQFLQLIPSLSGDNIFQASVNRSSAEIVQGSSFVAEDVAIDGGIFANFASFGIVDAPAISGSVSISTTETGQQLRGFVRNDTDFMLEDAVILARNRFYRLPEGLAAGAIFDFESSIFTAITEDTADLLPMASALESVFALDLGNELRNRQATIDSLVSSRVVMALPWAVDSRVRDIEFIELEDEEANRRRALLYAFMRDQYATQGLGNNVYLIGWSSESRPIDFTVSNSEYRSVDTSLYIVQLSSEIETPPPNTPITILPDQFTWLIKDRNVNQVLGGLNDMTLINPATVELRLMPIEGAVLEEVTSINIELDRSSSYGREVELLIWNWETQEWDDLENPRLEIYEITNPAPYLGANNMIDLRVSLEGDLVSTAASARIRGLRVTMVGSF